jgi:4-hydroxy-tetrahydrodipicolinate synthase
MGEVSSVTMLGHVLTAIVTPFRDDGSVDFHRFAELAQHLVENGSDGLVVAGTTGESPTLSEDERLELFRVAVGAVGDRATVVAGTGTYSTAESIHLTEKAHEVGVDGILVVTPYYSKPPQRGIVEHFKAIAKSTDRPVVVYNIPGRVALSSRRRSSTSMRATTTSSSRSSSSAASGASACTRTSSGRRWRRWCGCTERATSRAHA